MEELIDVIFFGLALATGMAGLVLGFYLFLACLMAVFGGPLTVIVVLTLFGIFLIALTIVDKKK